MLNSPRFVIVGTSDVAVSQGFFELLDFALVHERPMSAEEAERLYGVGGALSERRMAPSGQPHDAPGGLALVGPLPTGAEAGPYDTGPQAFDVYSRDLDRSLERLTAAGWSHGPIGDVELGPLSMRQVVVDGPDGITVVLIESERRRPSLLDQEAGRLHSEGHSLVWAVGDIPAALEFWRGLPGLTVPFDAPVAHPEVNRFMRLPDQDVTLRMAMVCDEQVSPTRLELLQFVGAAGEAKQSWPLRAGLHAPCFIVDDITAARAALPGAELGLVLAGDDAVPAACTGLAPGGVRFQLRERH